MSSLPLFEAEAVAEREPPERPARVHLSEILRLRAAPQRREALTAITDPKLRALVRFYVEDYFARRSGRALPNLSRIEEEEANEIPSHP